MFRIVFLSIRKPYYNNPGNIVGLEGDILRFSISINNPLRNNKIEEFNPNSALTLIRTSNDLIVGSSYNLEIISNPLNPN